MPPTSTDSGYHRRTRRACYISRAFADHDQITGLVVAVFLALEEHAAVAAEADVAELHLRAAAVPAHVTIRVSRVHNNGASAFRCNAIQPLEGVVAEAQAVARRGRHGRQAAVAFFAVAVGVALRVGLRAERPALAGEAERNLIKMKYSALADFPLKLRGVFIDSCLLFLFLSQLFLPFMK